MFVNKKNYNQVTYNFLTTLNENAVTNIAILLC